MQATQYRANRTIDAENLPDKISFGGEYSFLKTDNMETALSKLFSAACEIGGMVRRADDNTIKVTGCYNRGYWELYWDNPSEGVFWFTYFMPIES